MQLPLKIDTLTQLITAVGSLGTASFGVVDASKALNGGPSNFGSVYLRCLIEKLAPKADDGKLPPSSALTSEEIYATVKANWLNGMPVADQKSVVKALIKLRLNPGVAPGLATITGVDAALLTRVAEKLVRGTGLSPQLPAGMVDENLMTPVELDAYGRFDLMLSTLIDRAYQQADQRYRTWARALAALCAVFLALCGREFFVDKPSVGEAILIGALAIPLAPIAKDLSTALTTAVGALKSSRN